MKIRTLIYCIGQGFRNLGRNKSFTAASIATIASCLFLFSMLFSVAANIQNILYSVEKGVSVTVFFDPGITDERIQEIGAMINQRPEVDHTEFISAEQAWDSFKTEYLGEYADGFTENPLEDMSNYQIYLADVSLQGALVDWLTGLEGVRKVNQSEATASTLTGINAIVAYVSVGLIVILLAVSIFLISNTVNVGISVRREEIGIMKYIGATDFFVRSPFVIECMIIGAMGAAIPLATTYYLYNRVATYLTVRFSTLSNILSFLTVNQVMKFLAPVCFAIGIGIGFIGSFVTVRRHLKV